MVVFWGLGGGSEVGWHVQESRDESVGTIFYVDCDGLNGGFLMGLGGETVEMGWVFDGEVLVDGVRFALGNLGG